MDKLLVNGQSLSRLFDCISFIAEWYNVLMYIKKLLEDSWKIRVEVSMYRSFFSVVPSTLTHRNCTLYCMIVECNSMDFV